VQEDWVGLRIDNDCNIRYNYNGNNWENKMKTGIGLVILFLAWVMAFTGLRLAYAETIYIKGGDVIQAKITEKTDTVIWYELTSGDMVEYVGINIVNIEKILNDDGSASKYSPTKTEVAK